MRAVVDEQHKVGEDGVAVRVGHEAVEVEREHLRDRVVVLPIRKDVRGGVVEDREVLGARRRGERLVLGLVAGVAQLARKVGWDVVRCCSVRCCYAIAMRRMRVCFRCIVHSPNSVLSCTASFANRSNS